METKHNNEDNVYTILFVCSGNSCRSPMAAGLLQKQLFSKYGNMVKVHSAGTLGIENTPATLNAINVAKEKGVDISTHRSKGIIRDHLEEADIVFSSTPNPADKNDVVFFWGPSKRPEGFDRLRG